MTTFYRLIGTIIIGGGIAFATSPFILDKNVLDSLPTIAIGVFIAVIGVCVIAVVNRFTKEK
jgi:xanthine/uracil permease